MRENPFYNNYVFTEDDLYLPRLDFIDRLSCIFRPMYVQFVGRYVVHFKTKADGRIFVFKVEAASWVKP